MRAAVDLAPDLVDDPMLAPKDAAKYLGIKPRTLRKLKLPRQPMLGEGLRWGYRRSTLNRLLRERAQALGASVPNRLDSVSGLRLADLNP